MKSNNYHFSEIPIRYLAGVLFLLFFLSGCCTYQIFPGGEHHCALMEFESLVEEGRYREAFKQLDPKGLEDASYGYQVQYDILNVLVNGRSVKKEELFTYPTFLKYPDSISWTMLSCKVLVIYLDTGTVDAEALETMKKYNKDKLLWLKSLQDLGKL